MFGFFRKSKKENATTSKTKESQGKTARKNNSQNAEIAYENDSISMPNDYVGATRKNSLLVPEDKQAVMWGKNHPENGTPSRSVSVKPCGHGTTAVTPWIPPAGANRSTTNSPSASPVLEVKKQFRITGIENVTGGLKDENVKKMKGKFDNGEEAGKVEVDNGFEEDKKKNLINQEAKFQSQLNELTKLLSVRDAEANKLKFQMEELQRDVFAKSAGMDRLETELGTARKECDLIRQRIKMLEEDLEAYRKRNSNLNDELEEKTEYLNNYEKETKSKIQELEAVIEDLRQKIQNLENQLKILTEEKLKLEERHAELTAERDEEKRKVAEALEQAVKQKKEIEQKWKEDFEKLRTINILKEQQLLDDFEWKLREVQQTCKKRLEAKDKDMEERLQNAYIEAENKMKEAEAMMEKLESLKSYEMEVEQLRSITVDQEKAMQELLERQEQMKQAEESLKHETKKLRTLIDLEKENLQHMQRVHHQEILDKERKLKQTLNEKRTEIAMYWEERLLTECARLKYELEQIHSEEKWNAMESVRKIKDENFQQAQKEWEQKLRDCLKEVASLKRSLIQKDEYYREELIRQQTATDRDIMELRRLMDKIDMSHHDKYEKLVLEHDNEIEKLNEEHEKKIKEVEDFWRGQVETLQNTIDQVKEQMEKESQIKIEELIQQHRDELNLQWDDLIKQKGESVQLMEEEYISKYKILEEQFHAQQKSHSQREVELLKTIDSLKNELQSQKSTTDDLQNNVDTLEGGVQVLNREIAQQCEDLAKSRRESDQKIKGLLGTIAQLNEKHEKENETYRLKLMNQQKQSQETIDHLQRKCQCLTKLFEEVRQRYERRESRQEDLNTISDLRQIIAEQEKDLACINEEKRYFQMRLMALEKHFEETASVDEEEYEDARGNVQETNCSFTQNGNISIPPTIPECDDCDE